MGDYGILSFSKELIFSVILYFWLAGMTVTRLKNMLSGRRRLTKSKSLIWEYSRQLKERKTQWRRLLPRKCCCFRLVSLWFHTAAIVSHGCRLFALGFCCFSIMRLLTILFIIMLGIWILKWKGLKQSCHI